MWPPCLPPTCPARPPPSRRLLENFSDLAAEHHVTAVKRPMEDSFEVGGPKYADAEKIHIVAMQVGSGVVERGGARVYKQISRQQILCRSATNGN